ncbi:MAG: hypothetical protein LUQ07_04545, partial [Methanospirillum sp.]|nr:hypothetical protein [Methanospirillum sp.]
ALPAYLIEQHESVAVITASVRVPPNTYPAIHRARLMASVTYITESTRPWSDNPSEVTIMIFIVPKPGFSGIIPPSGSGWVIPAVMNTVRGSQERIHKVRIGTAVKRTAEAAGEKPREDATFTTTASGSLQEGSATS